MLLRASLTKLETELVVKPRPKMPLLRLFAVLRELLALVEVAPCPVAPEALLLATAAKVSRSETAEVSELEEERLGTLRSGLGAWSELRLGTLTLVSLPESWAPTP